MAEALPDLPVSETVMVRLIRISANGMSQFFDPVFRAMRLTENSFHVLCLLTAADEGRASPSELSDLVGISRGGMTRILDVLVEDGLVSRVAEDRDGRRYAIQITRKGRQTAANGVPRLAQPLKRAFSGLSAEEFAQLDGLLRKLIMSFDQAEIPIPTSG
jgi:MarR family transcriptional repressor of emrRAB